MTVLRCATTIRKGNCLVEIARTVVLHYACLASMAGAGDDVQVRITGGPDPSGHNYAWTVANEDTSPIVRVEFPHIHADLFLFLRAGRRNVRDSSALATTENQVPASQPATPEPRSISSDPGLGTRSEEGTSICSSCRRRSTWPSAEKSNSD